MLKRDMQKKIEELEFTNKQLQVALENNDSYWEGRIEDLEKNFEQYNDYNLCLQLMRKQLDSTSEIERLTSLLDNNQDKTIQHLKDHIVQLSMARP